MQDLLFHDATVVTMDASAPSSSTRRSRCATGASSKSARRAICATSTLGQDHRLHAQSGAAGPGRSARLSRRQPAEIGRPESRRRRAPQDAGGPAARFTDEEWWEADAQLNALERLKMGTTCMFSMMGGNGTRTDDVVFTQIAARELERIGLRTRIGLGPARPPWPRRSRTGATASRSERMVDVREVIDNCDRLLSGTTKNGGGIVDYGVALSRIGNRNEHDPVWSPEREQWIRKQAEAIAHLKEKHGVTFWTHMYGNAVEYAHDEKLGLLGPDTILSHCTGISERAIGIMRDTGTHAAHHPRAGRIYTYPGRCPVPELIDAGVTVALGSDSPSTHNCDIFLDMKAAIDQQRIHFKDANILPPGKVARDGDDRRLQSARTGQGAGIGGSRQEGGPHHRRSLSAAPLPDRHAGLPARLQRDRGRRRRRGRIGAARHGRRGRYSPSTKPRCWSACRRCTSVSSSARTSRR